MKKLVFLFIAFSCLSILSSCSKDDESEFPKTVNIKYEITTTRGTDAIINRTINNATEEEYIFDLPYNFTYAQEEVNEGTYLKLSYLENGLYQDGYGGSSWTDYDATLSIFVDEELVKTETFSITENESGIVLIDYTF